MASRIFLMLAASAVTSLLFARPHSLNAARVNQPPDQSPRPSGNPD